MVCLDTIRSLKINLKKKINTIVLVVEGASYEFDLFDQIFRKVLHYKLVTNKRTKEKIREYNEYVFKGNEDQKIVIINTNSSNIGSITDDVEYRNNLYKLLYEKYLLDIKNVPVYYIWDRDEGSNDKTLVKRLISKMSNPYDNDDYDSGLLLLSYPCVESYTISCFEKDKIFVNGHPKEYCKKHCFWLLFITKHSLLKATLEMLKQLKRMGIDDFNIDDIKNINLFVLKYEDSYFKKNKKYMLLSFISYILLDQQIITFR